MENRESQETPNRYSGMPGNLFPPSPVRFSPEINHLPQYPQSPGSYYDSLLSDINQLTLSSPPHHSVGPSDSVLENRVQSAARGQNSNLYSPQEYEFTGHELGLVDSALTRVRSGARGKNSNLYGLGGYGSTYDDYLSYMNGMSANQYGLTGRPRSRLYGSFDPEELDSAYFFNSQSNLNGLVGRSGPSRGNGLFSMGLNQSSLLRSDPMYVPNGHRQPNISYGLGRSGPTHPSRPNRAHSGLGQEYSNWNLAEFRGNIKVMVKDRDLSGYLRWKIEEGTAEDLEMIFEEIKDDVAGLMMNYCGSNVVQKLFKVCRPEQIDYMLALLLRDKYQFVQICCDNHGSSAMDKLLEKLTTSHQRSSVLSALRGVVIQMSNDQNAHKVVQRCITNFPDVGVVIDEITRECLDIATHKSGCCVLQNCFDRVTHQQLDRLMHIISPHVPFLSEHPYGNYVVQYLLGKEIPSVTSHIIHQLYGNFVSLSMNKCGSNVVEKCIACGSRDETAKIIVEIMDSSNFLMVLQDSFGNYVVQKALDANNKREIMMKLELRIKDLSSFLHSHPFGNRVLSKVMSKRHF